MRKRQERGEKEEMMEKVQMQWSALRKKEMVRAREELEGTLRVDDLSMQNILWGSKARVGARDDWDAS